MKKKLRTPPKAVFLSVQQVGVPQLFFVSLPTPSFKPLERVSFEFRVIRWKNFSCWGSSKRCSLSVQQEKKAKDSPRTKAVFFPNSRENDPQLNLGSFYEEKIAPRQRPFFCPYSREKKSRGQPPEKSRIICRYSRGNDRPLNLDSFSTTIFHREDATKPRILSVQ